MGGASDPNPDVKKHWQFNDTILCVRSSDSELTARGKRSSKTLVSEWSPPSKRVAPRLHHKTTPDILEILFPLLVYHRRRAVFGFRMKNTFALLHEKEKNQIRVMLNKRCKRWDESNSHCQLCFWEKVKSEQSLRRMPRCRSSQNSLSLAGGGR